MKYVQDYMYVVNWFSFDFKKLFSKNLERIV